MIDRKVARETHEFFATPSWSVRRILERLRLPGGAWLEPCAGEGAIIRAVNRADVRWTAIEQREECRSVLSTVAPDVQIGDFIARAAVLAAQGRHFSVAPMNPPFSLATIFAELCLELADDVVMLQRLNWLESAERHPFISQHMPDVYVLPDRPNFTGEGGIPGAIAWFVWPKGEHDRNWGRVYVLDLTSPEERAESVDQLQLFKVPAPIQVAPQLELAVAHPVTMAAER